MKTKLLLIAIVLFSFTFANAQTYKEIEKKAKDQTEKMVKALDLTDDQEVMIFRQNYSLLEQKSRFDKLENKTEEAKASMANMENAYKENVEKLLTDEQRVVFTEWAEKSKMLKD